MIESIRNAFRIALLICVLVAGAAIAGPLDEADVLEAIGDYAGALKRYRTLADQGDAEAATSLGTLYLYGRGAPKDYGEALKWFGIAAQRGNARGQANLAYMLESGSGAAKDEARAAELYRKSAEQGNAYAQANLGNMYLSDAAFLATSWQVWLGSERRRNRRRLPPKRNSVSCIAMARAAWLVMTWPRSHGSAGRPTGAIPRRRPRWDICTKRAVA
jgi:hypothetical protein